MPKSSSTGPKAPAVPWPPTMGMEPVHRPTSGSICSRLASPTAIKFWLTISTMTTPRNTIIALPPLFSTFRFA